jgi:hypothetical protein
MRRALMAVVALLLSSFLLVESSRAAYTTTILTGYNTRYIELAVQRDSTRATVILVCDIGATECTINNAENSTKVKRYDCYGGNSLPCGHTQFESLIYNFASLYSSWRANSPADYGPLPAGTYNVKIYEELNNDQDDFVLLETIQIRFPEYSFTFNSAPTIKGDPVVGSTLSLSDTSWSPTPDVVEYLWMRCNKQIPLYPDLLQIMDTPYTMGLNGTRNMDCYYLNQDGSIKEPTIDPGITSVQPRRVNGGGFTSYQLTEKDLGQYITVRVITESASGLRDYSIASTAIIEKKTTPMNQTTPEATFVKTKKIKELTVGAQVAATSGTWKWANTVTYQWFACTKRQGSTTSVNTKQCKAIKNATKANYKVKKSDKGRFLVAQVTAVNEVGSSVIYATSLKKIK